MISFICSLLIMMACSSTVYVSSSRGDDDNDGSRPSKAVKTIERACEISNDIRLKNGDWFYERVIKPDVRIRCYGSRRHGRPVLCGFMKVPAGMKGPDGGSIWERGAFDRSGCWYASGEGNIYRIAISSLKDGFSSTASEYVGNIGTLYDPASDTMYGRKCQAQSKEIFNSLSYRTHNSYRYPEKDMDFYQPLDDFRYVYVMASDPALLTGREIWMSAGMTCISGPLKDIKGVKVFGWGCHGAAVRHDVLIDDCEFDIIGGSFLRNYAHWVRYGNGTEFWATDSWHSVVSNCRYSRVYDTGTTIQGPMDVTSRCDSIIFRNNTFIGCRQDFEVWIQTQDGSMPTRCAFIDNKGYDSGANGFENDEWNKTHLLHYVNSKIPISGITIENNEFFGGDGVYCSTDLKDMPVGKTVYHCAEGAPILRTNKYVLTAPEKVEGGYRYLSAVIPAKEWTVVPSMKEALEGLHSIITELTGSPYFTIIVE